jgi:predicted GIY-YIG superfamily endonuclease
MHEPTTLYRYFDEYSNLLYVGITNSISRRASEHYKNSEWHRYARYATLEHYPTRDDALDAEIKAIVKENPHYNIAGSNQYTQDAKTHWSSLFNDELSDPLHTEMLQYITDTVYCTDEALLSRDKFISIFRNCVHDIFQGIKIPCIACRILYTSQDFIDADERVRQIEGENR